MGKDGYGPVDPPAESKMVQFARLHINVAEKKRKPLSSLSQTGTDVYFRSISSTSIVLGGGKEEWPFSVLVRKPMLAIPISFLLARILLSESRRVCF